MKKLLVYSLAALLALPVMGAVPDGGVVKKDGEKKTEVSSASTSAVGRKKNKKGKKKRKNMYRPGARQN